MSPSPLPITTAGTRPDLFPGLLLFAGARSMVIVLLALAVIAGAGLRMWGLGDESLGEDELNKLETVAEYRTHGLSGKNGEHPFLMKGLQTVSVSAAEILSNSGVVSIREEAALRFPLALAGTLSIILIFLLVSELFGSSLGLVSALFWALEPVAIGFDRIAKEDALVLFFFLLSSFLWVRGQTRAELGDKNWTRYAWGAGIAFAGLMASKYYPHLLAILGAYYIVFQYIPATQWRMEPARWFKFLLCMGIAFLLMNPTILLPETWREMLKFSSESRIGHDSYEYWGKLYPNKMTAWLEGVPWTFYYVFIAVKTSLPVLILFLIGLPLMFRRNMGDGRFFLFFWAFMWFLPFTFLGGKFTRYFTFVEPLIMITAAAAFCFICQAITRSLKNQTAVRFSHAILLFVIVGTQLVNAASAAPHYRLFTNLVGQKVTDKLIFPHDEVYDAVTRDVVDATVRLARHNSVIASETPGLFAHYSRNAGRVDLNFVSLSEKEKVRELKSGDLIAVVEGRRYFSNSAYLSHLHASATDPVVFRLNGTVAAKLYLLNEDDAAALRGLAAQ